METRKTDQEKKSEIINALVEVIDKNTKTQRDVWCIIQALQDASEFMEDKRYQFRNSLPFDIRCIREQLTGNKNISEDRRREIVSIFDDLSDNTQEAIMTAGANAEGLVLLHSMNDELSSVSDLYNS